MEHTQNIEIQGYSITADANLIDKMFEFTAEIKQEIQQIFSKIEHPKNSLINKLQDLIEKYPHIPHFKNYLSVAYSKQGNKDKAHEVNRLIVKEHPDYLFGKLNLANEYIVEKQYDKVPEILGELMEIKALYPDRTEFHVDEVFKFYRTAIDYFIGIENIEAAQLRLDIVAELDTKFNILTKKEMLDFSFKMMAIQVKKGLEYHKKQRAKAKGVEVIPLEIEQTTEKPIFENEIINQLYVNDMHINHDILKQILSLPRETLIPDLHKVIYDSMARFDYFADETEWDAKAHEFVFHAIYLLIELKSEESLDVFLDVLRQDDDYFDYWFSDLLSEEFWQYVFVFGQNKLDKLKNFLFEPNRYCYARAVISHAVSQMYLHFPEKRNEIINWYREVIEEFIAKKDDDSIIDTDLIGFIVHDLLDIKGDVLLPLIKQLYDNELTTDDICGDYNDVVKDFESEENFEDEKREIPENIFARYKKIIETRFDYQDDDKIESKHQTSDKFAKSEYYTDYDELKTEFPDELRKNLLPVVNQNKKVGRNDPCPCGSGKKYKKCCLKE